MKTGCLALTVLIAIFAALGTNALLGQSAGSLPSKAPNPTAQASPSTSATLQSLIKALSGKWVLNVRFEPNTDMPKAITGTGEESWRAGPGELEIIEDERIPTPGGDGLLLALIWWDGRSKSFRGMQCNNQLPFTCDVKASLTDITVTWNDKTLEVDEIETHDGKKTIWQETWSNITPASFTQTGDMVKPDGTTVRFMNIQATKAGSPAS